MILLFVSTSNDDDDDGNDISRLADKLLDVIHQPTFQREYEAHWSNPSETPPMWLGLLYAMLCLSMQSYYRAGDEPLEYRGQTKEMASVYCERTTQCLVLADFTRPAKHTLETLVLYLQAEYSRTKDAEVGVWILVGMIVRIAMRMGYHRDPKPYPSITAFQGEMRRRVWTFIRCSDLLFSFHLGLPTLIRMDYCDTGLPRNIYDDELREDMAELPPSRPTNEPTPISYMITKARFTFAFGNIVEFTNKV